jgi:predicted Zn-dependent peptidase
VKNYNAVTKEDLQRVARKYFGANNRTVATLLPDNSESPAAPEPTSQEKAKP